MARAGAKPASQRYPNRSDLTRPAPVTTVPGQPYGAQTQQAAAQHAQPMGQQPIAQSSGQPNPGDLMAQAIAHNGPGIGVQLDQPTTRPNEPVTHGLPGGPGAGPEALTGVGAAARDNSIQQGTLRNLLTSLASQPTATAAVRQLAAVAQAGAQ